MADAAGRPATFDSARAAGKWVVQEGYAAATPQRLEPVSVTTDEGTRWHVQEAGAVEPPAEGVPSPGVHPGVDAARSQLAVWDAQVAAEGQRAMAASATHGLSPETATAGLEATHPGQMVRVDPDTLVELAAEGHEPFPHLAAQIYAAHLSGGDVEVPLSEYQTALAGQPYAARLNDTTTFREGGVSVEEGQRPAPSVSVPPTTVAPPEDFSPEERVRGG